MLIGIRILLLLAVMGAGILLLAYLFTRNPRFLQYTVLIAKAALGIAALIGLVYLAERLLRL